MEILLAVLFGVVQGITEFLPISSSGHLVLLHNFFNLPISDEMAFDVALHLATLLAVVSVFYLEIIKLAKSFFMSMGGKHDEYSRTAWLIVLATIPAVIFGLTFGDLIEAGTRDNETLAISIISFMLVAVALLFLWVEKQKPKEGKYTSLKWKNALFIGFAQALALIPGTSRSGITIIAGLKSGLQREEAIKFSFLLSIPAILGASALKIPGLFESTLPASELLIIIFGFLASFIAGFLSIKYFLKFARTNTLNIFAYYRISLAVFLILYLLF